MSVIFKCGKVAYITAQDAWREADVISKRRKKESGRTRGPLRPYKCPNCKDWHLTSAEVPAKHDPKKEKYKKKKNRLLTEEP